MPRIVAIESYWITKQAALTGQLRQAIILFFGKGDIVAIHTLAGAATQLAADLLDATGTFSLLPLRRGTAFKEEVTKNKKMWREIRDSLKRAEGFFKHADRDGERAPDAAFEYSASIAKHLLFEACHGAVALGISNPHISLYHAYYTLVLEPDLLHYERLGDSAKKGAVEARKFLQGLSMRDIANYLDSVPVAVMYQPHKTRRAKARRKD